MEAKVSLATILKQAATGSIYVTHEPRTKRYGRAEIHLNAIVQRCKKLDEGTFSRVS